MIKEQLPIHKQYLVISAPTSFSLVANNGTDKVYRPSGIWQLDCYKLLPEKFMKNYPMFVLELEYDEEQIPEGFAFEYYFTNLNLGDSLKGVSGDLVELPESQLNVLVEKIKDNKRILLYENENFDYGVNTFPNLEVNKFIQSGVILYHTKDNKTISVSLKDCYLKNIVSGGSDHGQQYLNIKGSVPAFLLDNYYFQSNSKDIEISKYIFTSDNLPGYFSVELVF